MTLIDQETLFPALIKTIRQSAESIAEGIDAIKDLAADGTVLENIPIASTAVKVLRIKDAFSQNRLERNCREFLRAMSTSSPVDVEGLNAALSDQPDGADEFTDTVVSVLIEGQKPIKASLLGRLVVALSQGRITFEEFEQLSQIVHAAPVPSLNAIPKFFARSGGSASMNGTGRIEEEPLLMSLGAATRFGTGFYVSRLGKQLYEIGFEGQVRD
jgi:hypothetical protein